MGDLTAANSVITLSIGTLFPVPQQLQGFAADDVMDIPRIQSVEVLMGVDGVLSGGFVFREIVQRIMLQADSASNAIFDQWWTQMVASLATFQATGQVRFPSIGTKFNLTGGFLTGYKPSPAARRILQPREYEITWNLIAPAPA
jgi:hypothetical protein